MSLEQFLGLSHEIKIIDFLMGMYDFGNHEFFAYTPEELSDLIDVDESTIKYFIKRMQYNGLIEVVGDKIRLPCNEIILHLRDAVFANCSLIAGYDDGVDENNFEGDL